MKKTLHIDKQGKIQSEGYGLEDITVWSGYKTYKWRAKLELNNQEINFQSKTLKGLKAMIKDWLKEST